MVCKKNTHAMTLAVVHEKNTHAMTLGVPYVVCLEEQTCRGGGTADAMGRLKYGANGC